MVAIVTNPSIANNAFVGAVLAGALSAASGREVSAAALGGERYFLGSAPTASRVRGLVAQGRGFADILAGLQGGTS
jgi:hypothetical protein